MFLFTVHVLKLALLKVYSLGFFSEKWMYFLKCYNLAQEVEDRKKAP